MLSLERVFRLAMCERLYILTGNQFTMQVKKDVEMFYTGPALTLRVMRSLIKKGFVLDFVAKCQKLPFVETVTLIAEFE